MHIAIRCNSTCDSWAFSSSAWSKGSALLYFEKLEEDPVKSVVCNAPGPAAASGKTKQLGKDTQCNVETRWADLYFVRSKSHSMLYTCASEKGY